jgi:signal transduction histidine kinase
MQVAIKPENEEQRIEALKSYNILDTLPEKEYDDITQLASFICNTPTALISLVDNDRQWFKSKVGIDANETHRDIAFCSHAVLNPDELLVVKDANKDERFEDNPLIAEPENVKFYAGCPLTTPTGESLGTLCVIDSVVREITPEQEASLKVLAGNVMHLLELRKAKEEQKKLIEKLYSSNNELERFAYIASHDLQEPMRAVNSYMQLLSKRYKGKLDSTADKYINNAIDSCNHMDTLIKDLLEFSRLETNKNKKTWSCTNKIVNGVMQSIETRVSDTNAQVTWGDLPELYVDKMQMHLVFQNLILNAIKYNQSEIPTITIQANKIDDAWIIKFKDNGISVEEKFHDKIFEIFKRLHPRSKYNGTGMGLSICKKIIEQHGGKIGIESKPNDGSTFIISLPATKKLN